MSFIFSEMFSHLIFTVSLLNSPKKIKQAFSAFFGHPLLMVDVPVDEADDTTDACTTQAVCDDGMSENK